MYTNFNVASLSRISARTFAWKSTNMVGTLAIIQTWIWVTFIVLVVAQFARKTYKKTKLKKIDAERKIHIDISNVHWIKENNPDFVCYLFLFYTAKGLSPVLHSQRPIKLIEHFVFDFGCMFVCVCVSLRENPCKVLSSAVHFDSVHRTHTLKSPIQ